MVKYKGIFKGVPVYYEPMPPEGEELKGLEVFPLRMGGQNTMDLQEKINTTVIIIREFDHKCSRDKYTDTGEAWDVLYRILGIWETLCQIPREDPPELQAEKKPGTEPRTAEMDPQDGSGTTFVGQVDP
jgi:hypothetical protein